jgi:hypothetical protein
LTERRQTSENSDKAQTNLNNKPRKVTDKTFVDGMGPQKAELLTT